MKILTKYTIKAIMGPLLGGIFAFTSVLVGLQMINLLRMAEKYHLSLLYTLKLLVLTIPQNVTIGASISVLLAILLGLGALTSHSETIAMRTGGLSYTSLAVPILIIGLTVSIFGVLLNEYLVPASLQTYERLKAEAISKEARGTIYQFNKTFQEQDMRKLVYADAYEPQVQELRNVIIQELVQGKLHRTVSAAVMYWGGQGWYFTDAQIYQYTDDSLFPIIINKGRVKYDLSITPKEIEQFDTDPEAKSISELSRYIDKFARGVERQQLLVELHNKLAIPFASFVFAILGTPLALRPQRRSNVAGFGLCIIYILVWYVLMGVGDSLARAGSVPAFFGAWLPNIVLAGYGIYIFFKVKS
jgi:lipopolysaccharide export system permease protein